MWFGRDWAAEACIIWRLIAMSLRRSKMERNASVIFESFNWFEHLEFYVFYFEVNSRN